MYLAQILSVPLEKGFLIFCVEFLISDSETINVGGAYFDSIRLRSHLRGYSTLKSGFENSLENAVAKPHQRYELTEDFFDSDCGSNFCTEASDYS